MNFLNIVVRESENKIINQNLLYFWNYICRILYIYIQDIKLIPFQNGFNLYLRNTNSIFPVLYFLKVHTNCQFVILSDLFGIDFMKKQKKRFQVVYCLLSIRYNTRIRINILVDDYSQVPSVLSLYKSAGWLERETWDMFGIYFENNNDLRRILTDYGFDGFPLRKDFPLSGYIELRYDDSLKRVVYEPIEITQEFRFFDFKSPWEQIENIY